MAWVRARFPRLRFVSWLSRDPELMTHWRLQDLVTGLDRWLVSGERLARRILQLPELQTARLRYLRRGVEISIRTAVGRPAGHARSNSGRHSGFRRAL